MTPNPSHTASRRFLFTYRFAEAEWGITIDALDPVEAREKIKAVALARYDGEVVATIKVPSPFGSLLRWFHGERP